MKKFLRYFGKFSLIFLTALAILLIASAVLMIMNPTMLLTVIHCGIIALCGTVSLVIITFLIINLFSLKKKGSDKS